jgi:hypothetical protein
MPDGLYYFKIELFDYQEELVRENIGIEVKLLDNKIINIKSENTRYWAGESIWKELPYPMNIIIFILILTFARKRHDSRKFRQ